MSNWITIELDKIDGSAFEGDDLGPELARILRKLASKFEDMTREEFVNDDADGKLFDVNGNVAGYVSGNIEDDEDEQELYDEVRRHTRWMSYHEICKFVEEVCGLKVNQESEEDLVEAIVEAIKSGDIALNDLEVFTSTS